MAVLTFPSSSFESPPQGTKTKAERRKQAGCVSIIKSSPPARHIRVVIYFPERKKKRDPPYSNLAVLQSSSDSNRPTGTKYISTLDSAFRNKAFAHFSDSEILCYQSKCSSLPSQPEEIRCTLCLRYNEVILEIQFQIQKSECLHSCN